MIGSHLISRWRDPHYQRGVRDMFDVAPGIWAWGLMTGVAMVKSGLSMFEALLMALTVYAGSSQLAAMPLISAGAPVWVVLATAFCVNLRFVVFSIHMRNYIMHLSLPRRLLVGYLCADVNYFMFTARYPEPAQDAQGRAEQQSYLAGAGFINWFFWVVTSVIGIFLANVVPTRWSLGFAGILALLGIMSSLALSRMRLVAAGVSAAAAVAAYALPLRLNVLAAIAAAVAVCLLIERAAPPREGERA